MEIKIAWLECGTAQHLDDQLCPRCFKSGLWMVPVVLITSDGVSPYGYWSGCMDCHEAGAIQEQP